MHPEAYEWVRRYAVREPVTVLDIGGRDVNGSPRPLFDLATEYVVLDILPGEHVDIVADAAEWEPDRCFDVVVSTECFEHAPRWREIVGTAYKALVPGGLFIATMAGPGRPVHSGVDGGPGLHSGEHYGNVDPGDLQRAMEAVGFVDIVVDQQHSPADVRTVARR